MSNRWLTFSSSVAEILVSYYIKMYVIELHRTVVMMMLCWILLRGVS